MIKRKIVAIIKGESRSSNNGRAATRMISFKIMPSKLFNISLLYGLNIRCIKAIIAQALMSI